MTIGYSEAEPFWVEFLRSLARRGLRGVKLAVSDAHEGLIEQVAHATAATLERMERRLDQVAVEQRADFRWLLGVMLARLGTMIGLFGGVLGVIAHGFHWL